MGRLHRNEGNPVVGSTDASTLGTKVLNGRINVIDFERQQERAFAALFRELCNGTFFGYRLDELKVAVADRDKGVPDAEGGVFAALRGVCCEAEIAGIGGHCRIEVFYDDADMVDAFCFQAVAPSIGSALYWMTANGTPLVPPFTAAIFAPG